MIGSEGFPVASQSRHELFRAVFNDFLRVRLGWIRLSVTSNSARLPTRRAPVEAHRVKET